MTDDEIIKRARELCERGHLRASHANITRYRLRQIVSDEDALEARYMVPALLEIIERRGLRFHRLDRRDVISKTGRGTKATPLPILDTAAHAIDTSDVDPT